MRFFLSYRFWLPVLILVGLEIALGSGLYEPFLKEGSHSGKTAEIKRALRNFGYRNVNYVTLGDSRADVGLDHSYILGISQQYGQRHINMAMPGSHFTTFRLESDLLHKDFSNMKGVLLAISGSSMIRTFNGYYELAITAPFRQCGDYHQIGKFIPFDVKNVESYGLFSFFLQYREDIKDFVVSPRPRIKDILQRKQQPWSNTLAHGKWQNKDVCEVQLDTPETCLESVKHAIESNRDMSADSLDQYERIRTVCNMKKMGPPSKAGVEYARNSWIKLLQGLHFKKQPIVLLLPDSSFIKKFHFPDGTDEWALSMLEPMAERKEIILLDYRKMFSTKDECRYFSDPLHMNATGTEMLMKKLVPTLRVYYRED